MIRPVWISEFLPEVAEAFERYAAAIGRYGHVLYAIYAPGSDKDETLEALTAFLDLMFDERGVRPLARYEADAREIRARWFHHPDA